MCECECVVCNRKKKEEREETIHKVETFLDKNPIDVFTIKENGWNKALKIMRELRVSACDSIHIATAMEAKCSVFITSDSGLGKEVGALMKWLSPEEAITELRRCAGTQFDPQLVDIFCKIVVPPLRR